MNTIFLLLLFKGDLKDGYLVLLDESFEVYVFGEVSVDTSELLGLWRLLVFYGAAGSLGITLDKPKSQSLT